MRYLPPIKAVAMTSKSLPYRHGRMSPAARAGLALAFATAFLTAAPASARIRYGDSVVFAIHQHPSAVDDHGGLPTETAIAGVFPNPFNPRATIAYDLASAGAVRLEIYDVGGRLLRVLAAATLPAGHQEATWDGRDDSGREVAAGQYLCRLRAADVSSLRKLTLVR